MLDRTCQTLERPHQMLDWPSQVFEARCQVLGRGVRAIDGQATGHRRQAASLGGLQRVDLSL
jgi:hypothetical protein